MAARTSFRRVTHCIFDMDGTLLDTEKLYTQATQKILDKYKYGKTYEWEFKMTIMGLQTKDLSESVVAQYELPMTWQEYAKLQRAYNEELMVNAELMPGAERLIRHLHAHKVPICLATSSGEDMVNLKTTHHRELFSLFHHRVCGSSDPEVQHGKPAPDIFLAAASRFPEKPATADCLVFEDAPNGVKGATTAGMQVVMVPDPRLPENMRTLATQVLSSLEDFKPEQFGLPAFPST